MKIRYKIWFCLLIITEILCNPEIAKSQNPLKRFDFNNPKQKSLTFPFQYINNLIVIPVNINNSDTLNFILDSGISTTMITELMETDSLMLSFARKIRLQGLGVGEPLDGLHSYGNEIRVKGISGQNQDIYVILNNAFQLSSRMGMPIHGILGYSLLSNFIVSVNYDRKLITFYKPDRFKYKKKHSKYTCLPLEINDNKPYIFLTVTDKSGHTYDVKLLIDTGASHAIWLDKISIPGLQIPEGSKETYLGTGLSGEVHGYLGRMDEINLNGNILNDVIVSFPDSSSISGAVGLNQRNGSLGSEILRRFNLIIDYPNQKISLKPNTSFKSEFTQNLSGMEIIAPYPGLKVYIIEGIRQDSPAARSGLIKGDVIQSINGIKSEKTELSDIYELLQKQPGRKLSISFMRDGELMFTTLRLEKFI